MKRLLLAGVAALALCAPALAKPITITLDDQQQGALVDLLDVAQRAGGTKVTQNVFFFMKLIDEARTAAEDKPVDGTEAVPGPEQVKPKP